MKKVVLGFEYSKDLAKSIAKRNKCSYSLVTEKEFPDGENVIQINTDVKGKKVILVDSLFDPDEKLINICLTAGTAKELGAKSLTLVAPYLCYMRQDKRFHRGESVSSKIISKIINSFFDKLITIDPHLHRYKSLNIIYKIKTKKLTANPLIAKYIKKHYKNPFIIGPDAESYQWAESIAKVVGCGVTVCNKIRFSSRKVKVILKDIVPTNKQVIIVDDIISTGHTMIEVINFLRKHGYRNISCIGVHGLFVENAYPKLKKAGANKIITCNTIPHVTNKIDVSELINI